MSTKSTITVVRVQCPACGPVRVHPDRVLLSLYPTGATYAFTCCCGKRTAIQATASVVRALRAVGCTERRIVLPERAHRDAPPITTDELLDMLLALRRPGWEHELLA
jgi:hypothetical protein